MEAERAYTDPEHRGKCGFCPNPEDGYAMADKDGKVRAACWPCIDKTRKPTDPPKHPLVKSEPREDLDK